jgi:hypothetical protein
VKRVHYQAIKVQINIPQLDIQMVDEHYFEIGTTVLSSNWNSTSSGFHYATHLLWLQEWHPLQLKGLWLHEEWL